jgi:hypothetical protein
MKVEEIEINGKPYCRITIDKTHAITVTKEEALKVYEELFGLYKHECVDKMLESQCANCDYKSTVQAGESMHDAVADGD